MGVFGSTYNKNYLTVYDVKIDKIFIYRRYKNIEFIVNLIKCENLIFSFYEYLYHFDLN